MEKTYVKNVKIEKLNEGNYNAVFEISDDETGFYMPVTLNGKSQDKAIKKMNNFLGDKAVFVEQ